MNSISFFFFLVLSSILRLNLDSIQLLYTTAGLKCRGFNEYVDILVDNIVNDLIEDENNTVPNPLGDAKVEHVSSEREVEGAGLGLALSAASGCGGQQERMTVICLNESVEALEDGVRSNLKKRSIRQSSCPPGGTHSTSSSGPWSMEWLQSHKNGRSTRLQADRPVEMDEGLCRKKVGGLLNHSVHCLKKVARMSRSDRSEVLKIIRK